MRRYLPLIATAVLALAGPACETGGEPRILTLSGSVRDYFSNAALPGVLLDWQDPRGRTVTSSGTGAYTITNLMELDILFIHTTLTNYRLTRNEPVVLGTSDATADQAALSETDAARQYTAVGVSQIDSTGVVFVTLVNDAGQPHTGIPITDIFIADTLADSVGVGPFVFGSGGDLVSPATLSVTTAFNGRARVGFLNVPRGTFQLRVEYDDGGPRVKSRQVVSLPNGVTLVRR